VSVQVVIAVLDQCLNVCDGELAVPASVDVDHERAQTPLVNFDREKGAVDAPAQAEDAVVLLARSCYPDLLNDRSPACSAFLVGKPVLSGDGLELDAMIAHPVFVESNLGVRSVHHASGTGLMDCLAHVLL